MPHFPPVSQYWKVAAALLVIFLSGQGIGYVLGMRSRVDDPAKPPPGAAMTEAPGPALDPQNWADAALDGLRKNLNLTDEQVEAIRPEIVAAGGKVNAERERALFQIYLYLLDIHRQISPQLDDDQREQLRLSEEKLKQTIRTRFSALWDESSAGSPSRQSGSEPLPPSLPE